MRDVAIAWLHRADWVVQPMVETAARFPNRFAFAREVVNDDELAAASVCLLEYYSHYPVSYVLSRFGYGLDKRVRDRDGRAILELVAERIFQNRTGEFGDTMTKSLDIYLNERGWSMKHSIKAAKRYAMKKFIRTYYSIQEA